MRLGPSKGGPGVAGSWSLEAHRGMGGASISVAPNRVCARFGPGDLETWPPHGPPRARKWPRERKSIPTDPGRAPERPLRTRFESFFLQDVSSETLVFQFLEPIRFFRTAFEPGFLHDVSRETLVFQFFEPIHFFLNRMIGRKSHTKRSFSNFFEPIYLFSNRF